MYINKKRIYLLSVIFNVLFASFACAQCNGKQCNLERDSQGMWYGDVNMIGPVNREGFSNAPYSSWFVRGYRDYQPDQSFIEKIKNNNLVAAGNLDITVFIGTWCSDSQKHLPRLYKILDQAGFNGEQIAVHAMGIAPGEFRKTHNGLAEKGRNIYRVPTIIISKDSIELGRIIESPSASLEQDLLAIVQGAPYTPPAHLLEGELNRHLENYGPEGFENNIDALAGEFREKGIREDELNHYIAFNLLYSKRYREAAAVINMMLLIYPQAGHLHMTLARTYELLNNDVQALKSYRKAFLHVDDDGNMEIIRDGLNRSTLIK